jgi:hypothetical protein
MLNRMPTAALRTGKAILPQAALGRTQTSPGENASSPFLKDCDKLIIRDVLDVQLQETRTECPASSSSGTI